MEHIHDGWKEGRCDYCCHQFNGQKWSSEWIHEQHYKSVPCNWCGRKNWFRVDFQGSGHDNSPEKQADSIESIVRKVQEG